MAKNNPPNEVEVSALVTAAQNGNSEAFGRLYDLFIDTIYRYVYYRVSAGEAEDLTELIFLKTWENIGQYRPQKKSFSSWLFRIAHNVVVDYYRSQKYEDELTEDIEDKRRESQTVSATKRRFDKELLGLAMKELKDSYRQIIVLKYINELSNEEIGEITGKSQAALRILQFRALRHLKRILEDKGMHESDV